MQYRTPNQVKKIRTKNSNRQYLLQRKMRNLTSSSGGSECFFTVFDTKILWQDKLFDSKILLHTVVFSVVQLRHPIPLSSPLGKFVSLCINLICDSITSKLLDQLSKNFVGIKPVSNRHGLTFVLKSIKTPPHRLSKFLCYYKETKFSDADNNW